jgi:hypothetical protein
MTENPMDVDATLWLILAATVAFIACGCKLTAPARSAQRHRH